MTHKSHALHNNTHAQGYLKVKGTFSSWVKYWFVLKDKYMLKYKSPKDAKPIDEVDLTQNVSVMNADGLTYVFFENCHFIYFLVVKNVRWHCLSHPRVH